jgi:threonine dehydratase
MPTLADVRAAAALLRGQLADTPCLPSRTLSEICGCSVTLKFENLQFTASFKERGALARLAQLDAAERARGVLAVSAGNHAQGVAHHAQRLGIPAVIVMPRFTPATKVERTRYFGAEVILHGEDFDAARRHGLALCRERGLVLVHPYDDERVISGQGTVALEMLAAAPVLDALVVPVGGGGLICGMALAAKALKPGIEVIGVQAARFPSMYNALKGTALPCGPGSIADGIAVKEPGAITTAMARRLVDDVLLVEENAIEEAMLLLVEVEKTVCEGAGAAGLAALLAHRGRFAGRSVGIVLSGGNVDPLVLADIIQRGMARSGRLVRLSVALRDAPGALAAVTRAIAEAGANVADLRHQRAFSSLSAQNVEVEFVLQTRGEAHNRDILAALAAAGYAARALPPEGRERI